MFRYFLKAEKVNLTFEPKDIYNAQIVSEFTRKNLYKDDINIYESFFMILLNQKNTIIGFNKVSQGSINGTVIDIRLIAKTVIDALAIQVILIHNHPSQNTKPSDKDIEITHKISKCLKLFDVNVLDHIVVTNEDYFSFSENGML